MKYIEGVQIINLRQIEDLRGAVRHGLRANDPLAAEGIGEVYFSTVNPNVVKAWHWHARMTLRYIATKGRLTIGLYDDRPESPTYGHPMKIEIADNGSHYRMIIIPPCIWNGFRAREGSVHPATLCNIASIPHDPEEIARRPIESLPWGLSWGPYELSG